MNYNNISFKNTGTTISEIKKRNRDIPDSVVEFPIGIKLPLRKGTKKGETLFAMNFDIENQIKDNFKFLLTCRKNEMLMKPNYGTNLSVLFNSTNLSEEELNNLAKQEISQAVENFMNPMVIYGKSYFLNLESYSIEEDFNDNSENFYKLTIEYQISGYSRRDIKIINKMNNTENSDYLMSKTNKVIIKFKTSN